MIPDCARNSSCLSQDLLLLIEHHGNGRTLPDVLWLCIYIHKYASVLRAGQSQASKPSTYLNDIGEGVELGADNERG